MTRDDYRFEYEGVGKFVVPILRKDGLRRRRKEWWVQESVTSFLPVNQDLSWHPNSEFTRICFSNRLCVLCSFFLRIDATTHCRQQCPDASLAKSTRHNSVIRVFFTGSATVFSLSVDGVSCQSRISLSVTYNILEMLIPVWSSNCENFLMMTKRWLRFLNFFHASVCFRWFRVVWTVRTVILSKCLIFLSLDLLSSDRLSNLNVFSRSAITSFMKKISHDDEVMSGILELFSCISLLSMISTFGRFNCSVESVNVSRESSFEFSGRYHWLKSYDVVWTGRTVIFSKFRFF